jgi:hypothetical protein
MKDVRVIESSLKPLDGVGHERVLLEDHEVTGEGADSFRSHRVLFDGKQSEWPRCVSQNVRKTSRDIRMTTSVPSCRPWRTCRTGTSRSRSVYAEWLSIQKRGGTAYDPIWSFSKGSSISFRLANNRTARDRSTTYAISSLSRFT